jgi:hypothetical protein
MLKKEFTIRSVPVYLIDSQTKITELNEVRVLKTYKATTYTEEKGITCTEDLEQTSAEILRLAILILYSLYIQEIIVYVKEKCKSITNVQLYTYYTRAISDYHQHV